MAFLTYAWRLRHGAAVLACFAASHVAAPALAAEQQSGPSDAPTVDLELTYPVGNSPKVFTEGWVFGARCTVTRRANETVEDCSDAVSWSGSGSFAPAKGKTSRPRFAQPGANQITLSVGIDGERHERNYAVTAVVPHPYAKVGDAVFCDDALAHGGLGAHHLPGTIATGSELVRIDGSHGAARKGDLAIIPSESGMEARIETGDPNVLIEGRPAARQGDRLRCAAGEGVIGGPGLVDEPLPEPNKMTLQASRPKLPDPVAIKLRASRPKLPDPVAITLQAMRPELPDPAEITLQASRPELPDPVAITLQASRPELPDPVAITLQASRPKLPDPVAITLQASRPELPDPVEITLEASRPKLPDPVAITLSVTRPETVYVKVPAVIGQALAKAKEAISKAKLTPAESKGNAAKKKEQQPGVVYGVAPGVGKMVPLGWTVTLTYYDARPKKPVPKISGLTLDAARGLLGEQFVLGKPALGNAAPEDAEPGTIESSDPPAGTMAEIFSTVTPTVYGKHAEAPEPEGPALRSVPAVAGLTVKAANQRLREHNFIPADSPALGNPAPADEVPGRVQSSSPAAGELKEEGTTVVVTVWGPHRSEGPDTANQPSPRTDEDTGPELSTLPQTEPPEPDVGETEADEPQLSTLPQTGEPEREEEANGWIGGWSFSGSMPHPHTGRMRGNFEVVDEGGATFVVHRKTNLRLRAHLSGDTLRFNWSTMPGHMTSWTLVRQGDRCSGTMVARSARLSSRWSVTCKRL